MQVLGGKTVIMKKMLIIPIIVLCIVIISTCVVMKDKSEQIQDVTVGTLNSQIVGIGLEYETKMIKLTTTTTTQPATNKVTTTNKPAPKPQSNSKVELLYNARYSVCGNPLTRSMGVKYYNGHRETWYSQKVLPGNGLKIPGRHVADDGTIRDGSGYIVIASDLSYASRGSIIMTSLGPGKVYDTGCAYGTIDIYVNW